ncbi:TetR/AcrR family transcriptional regulator [Actinomadura sp. KC345]|uniref:TetR/AcrR family transcriptional regulator n=1 Tax=Actinomadura sp. KC345 TaxID=2530371 RepID=UPI001405279A|nr:TetR/AcrR family transcriptional regulator [Actinomadura sp. KC345]
MVTQVPTYSALPRHRHALGRDQVRSVQRARVLRAAAEAVVDKGYGKVTIGDIVRRAQVSTKTFYELFDDKESAFLAVYDDLDDLIDQVEVGAGDPRERLHETLTAALGLLDAEPHLTRMLAIDAMGGGPTILARRNQALRKLAALVAAVLGREPDDMLIMAYLGGTAELVVQHVTGPLPDLAAEVHRFTDALFFPTSRRPSR